VNWDLVGGDLYVGNNVGVTALFIARIHRRRGIAIGGAVCHSGIGIQRACIQRRIDLPEGITGARVHRAINVIARNIRRRTRVPG